MGVIAELLAMRLGEEPLKNMTWAQNLPQRMCEQMGNWTSHTAYLSHLLDSTTGACVRPRPSYPHRFDTGATVSRRVWQGHESLFQNRLYTVLDSLTHVISRLQ